MKLVHKSGAVRCSQFHDESYWGCRNPVYGDNAVLTIITNANEESVLPPVEDLKALGDGACGSKKHFYSLDGISHTSSELVFRHLSNPLFVSRNQELQIWDGQDWITCSENNNSGTTCVDVYAWYV